MLNKKKLNSVFAVGMIALFAALSVGCSTVPRTTAVPLSFAPESEQTAVINVVTGNPGLWLVFVDGQELPGAAEGTHWAPLLFPTGRPFNITVNAHFEEQAVTNHGLLATLVTSVVAASRGVNQNVLFECPPLDAGKQYKLTFRKGIGLTGKNLLVLTNAENGKTVHEQEFGNT
jgi:hypothetical protein